jgi:hypothetical protein
MQHDDVMELLVCEFKQKNGEISLMKLDCPSMEDEQGCSGSTPTYCRADQFRCGSTCIPNVSENKRRKNCE